MNNNCNGRPYRVSSHLPTKNAGIIYRMQFEMEYSATSESPEERIYTVSEITSLIKGKLEASFSSVWVEGELGRVTDHTSGHMYLTLKEEKDVIDATMWRSARKNLKFMPERGMQVLVKGRVSVYGPFGKYQIIVDNIEPAGIGALQIRFEQLKKKLSSKGFFDNERKKAIPEYPEIIGVVTSAVGAAFSDIARILKRRNPGVKIILAPVQVEGEVAKKQIVGAIDDFNRYGKVDVMIVGRGGGSPESLWAFNEEVVAEAIFRSEIPVISAVGHEIDFTIADFVADLRASTPSAAAELAVKNRADLSKNVASLYARIITAIAAIVKERRISLREFMKRPVLADPARFMESSRRRLDENFLQLVRSVKRNHLGAENRVRALLKQLQLLRPSSLVKHKKRDVENFEKSLVRALISSVGAKRGALAMARARFKAYPPERILELKKNSVENFRTALINTFKVALVERQNRFSTLQAKRKALSPYDVLERGYSILQKTGGGVITDMSQVEIGDALEVRLSKGGLTTRVVGKKPLRAP